MQRRFAPRVVGARERRSTLSDDGAGTPRCTHSVSLGLSPQLRGRSRAYVCGDSVEVERDGRTRLSVARAVAVMDLEPGGAGCPRGRRPRPPKRTAVADPRDAARTTAHHEA